MPVKLALKWGAFEIATEAETPEQCDQILDAATGFLNANPAIGRIPMKSNGTAVPVVPNGVQIESVSQNGTSGADAGYPDALAELLTHAGVSIEDFQKSVSMKDPAKPRLLPRLKDPDRSVRQRKGAAVMMAVAKRATGKTDWPVFELTQALKDCGIDASLLSKGLAEGDGSRFFGKSGIKAGTKYHLEVPGEDLAIQVLQELAQAARKPIVVAASPIAVLSELPDPADDSSSTSA